MDPFFVGSFPSVMAPQPEGRSPADALFQKFRIPVGQLEVRNRSDVVGDEPEFAVIISPFDSFDVCIINQRIYLFPDFLRPDEDRRPVMQEVDPMVNAIPFRGLIGDKADNAPLLIPFQLDHSSQRFFHGDAFSSELAAQLKEETVEHFIVKRMVDLCAMHPFRSPVT